MADALRQNRGVETNTVTSQALAYTSAVASGSLLVAVGRWGNTTGTASCSDSVNGSWTQVQSLLPSGSGSDAVFFFYFANTAAGTPTVTVSVSGGGSHRITLEIMEFTGIATASPLDNSTTSTSAGTSTPSIGSLVTSNSADLLISCMQADTVPETFTVSSPDIAVDNVSNNGIAGTQRAVTFYRDNSGNGIAAGTYTDSITCGVSSPFSTITAAFKLAGGGGGGPTNYHLLTVCGVGS